VGDVAHRQAIGDGEQHMETVDQLLRAAGIGLSTVLRIGFRASELLSLI
jgi:hypothetical protein